MKPRSSGAAEIEHGTVRKATLLIVAERLCVEGYEAIVLMPDELELRRAENRSRVDEAIAGERLRAAQH